MAQKKPKIIIVGSGIIGAASAFELQSRGAEVLLLDAANARATDASFGWINASFFENPEYFALRVEGIHAYHRLQKRLDVPVTWCGALAWECAGAAFDEQFQTLSEQGYPCEIVERSEIAALEPHLGNLPDRAIRFGAEGFAEPVEITQRFLNAAVTLGARVAHGFKVSGFEQRAGRITGVRTKDEVFRADEVLIAAGTGTEALLACLDVPLPMLHRPALVLKTKPVLARISHILATDFGEVRQLRDGSLLTPAAIGHQSDNADQLSAHPDHAAEVSMARLRALFPQYAMELASMHLAHRPIPQDGFPAVGQVMPGLYAATLHSGITLGALMGELIATEMLNGQSNESRRWLGSFRPRRFG